MLAGAMPSHAELILRLLQLAISSVLVVLLSMGTLHLPGCNALSLRFKWTEPQAVLSYACISCQEIGKHI